MKYGRLLFRSWQGRLKVQVYIYLTLPHGLEMIHGQFLRIKKSTANFNSEFSFSKTGCLTKAKESSLP